jgi:cell division protein FtsQ
VSSRRRVLVLVIVVGVLGTAAWMATRSPLLDVDHLVVRGNERAATEEVLEAGGLHRGDPIAWLDVDDAATSIEALPWIRDARVEREWPDTVRVTVRERRPVAWVDRGNGRALVVDPHGRVLDIDAEPPAGLPQLVDVATAGPVGGTITPVEGARAAGALHGIVQTSTRLIATADGRVTLQIASGQEIRLGRPTQLRAKVRAAVAVLGAPQAAGKTYVDVSAPSSPVAG